MKAKLENLKEIIAKNKTRSIGIAILGILVLIFLVFIAIYLLGTKNVSDIEKKAIKEKSKNLVYNIEEITLSDSKDIDKYIIFALKYSYNVNSKKSLTLDELYKFLKNNFTLKVTKKDIQNLGISPLMAEQGIIYNEGEKKFTLNAPKKSVSEISTTPITYYKLDKISKKSKKRYVITYRQYTIEEPYKMLDYYIDKNNKSGDITDVSVIRDYLLGNKNIIKVKDIIKDKDIGKYAKKGKKLKITYIYEQDTLKIEKIK